MRPSLAMLFALGAVMPLPPGETRAGAPWPPEVPRHPAPVRSLRADDEALARADDKRRRKAAQRLAGRAA